MSKIDGGLRGIFHSKIRTLHWVAVETWMTMSGVPDSNYCGDGIEGWVEFKQTSGGKIKQNKTTAFQIAFHERRARAGGRTFVAVRQKGSWLRLYAGRDIRGLYVEGLDSVATLYICGGGPGKWDWARIRKILVSP